MHKFWKKLLLCLTLVLFLNSCRQKLPAFNFSRYPSNETFIDADYYRHELLQSVDLWNGGLDGKSGMQAYSADFNGFFLTDLSRDWQRKPGTYQSAVSQSRGIYMNVEAYRHAPQAEKQKYLKVVRKGTAALLEYFRDKDYGGFYWQVTPSGTVKDNRKSDYGQFQALFALTHAFQVTADPAFYHAILEQMKIIESYFLVPEFPGAIHPTLNRDFTPALGVSSNIDAICHAFEAFLALYDLAEGELQLKVERLITQMGNFITGRLSGSVPKNPEAAYLSFFYDDQWNHSQIPFTTRNQWTGGRQAATGHMIGIAYLLSRAVEQGFNPRWLEMAGKYITFCRTYTMDPTWGGILYEVTDHSGNPLLENYSGNVFLWWPQAETARCFLHFSFIRGMDLRAPFKKVESLISSYLRDTEMGGWYASLYLDPATKQLTPDMLEKGNLWKVNYHCTMFYTEVLRLAELQALNTR